MKTDKRIRLGMLPGHYQIGQIIISPKYGFDGMWTQEYEILAVRNSETVDGDPVATFIQFFKGFSEPCIWNSNHVYRSATEEECRYAQEWMDELVQKQAN